MEHDLERTLPVLAQTPATLNALLRNLPSFWVSRNEGEGTWTVLDVVGHLVYTDRVNWMPRLRRILESGETRPFDPFDRDGHTRETAGKTLPGLLDEFAHLRAQNLSELRALSPTPADLERRGRHPALGSVPLSQLLATWTVHDLTHLHQITRILAFQYREEVGPWRKFLGVLHCNGHGEPA